MTPYGYHTHDHYHASHDARLAEREAIRQAKLVRKAAREAEKAASNAEMTLDHRALRRIFARAPHILRFGYLRHSHLA